MNKIRIVAEIGCNHNRDIVLAKKMMKKAKECGADAVKFQSFVPENLVSIYAPKAEYQKNNDTSVTQLAMLKKLALSNQEYLELVRYAQEIDIDIFSTAFDEQTIEFLLGTGQSIWKIPSGEITDLPYLEKISAIECKNKEIILSTGMSTIEEIRFAIQILKNSKKTKFTILHCNTQYPTEPEDMNLRAISAVHNLVPEWEVGLSDHSQGIIGSIVAIGMGVRFIEKHFTWDKKLPGPDHKASITPDELKELCDNVRLAETMLGSWEKKVTDSEQKNIIVARKSIVAKRRIKKGEILTVDNITCKRPGNGISPIHWYKVLGTVAENNFEADELITCVI